MNIEKLSDYAIKISLLNCDLKKHNISYETINSKSTAALILSLSDYIMRDSGIDITREKLYVEVFSSKKGCTIFISLSPSVSPYTRKIISIVIEFTDFSLLRDFCTFLQKSPDSPVSASSLYYNGKALRLSLKCRYPASKLVCDCATDFGTVLPVTPLSLGATEEYFECVEKNHAIRKIAKIT